MLTVAQGSETDSSPLETRKHPWGPQGPSQAEIGAAFTDGPELLRTLARWLLPVVELKVTYVLRPIALAKRRDLTTVRQDLVQDVLVELLRDGGKVLRQWDPTRGCSLTSFLALVTRCYIRHRFKQFKGNPWASDPVSAQELMALVDDGVPERATLADDLEHRQQLEYLYQSLDAKLNSRDRTRFNDIFVQQKTPAEVAQKEGVSENAIHQWSSRIIRKMRAIFGDSEVKHA